MKNIIEKYGIDLIKEVSFWEDTEMWKPFWYKVEQILKNVKVSKDLAESALKDYQHLMEV